MFKVGDRVKTLVHSTGVVPGDVGTVTGVVGETVKVRFDNYEYSCDTDYHGMYPHHLRLLTRKSKESKGISAFIKRVEKEYSNVKTA